MAKRLYDQLKNCQEEEEVKAEFAKYFTLKYNTRNKIDLYTPQILFEFKLSQNFASRKVRAKVVAQSLYYIRRLKYGVSKDPVPPTICIVDKNGGFFIQTSDFNSFVSAGKNTTGIVLQVNRVPFWLERCGNPNLSKRFTYMIQKLHLPVYHRLCLMLEDRFFGE